jgi:pimeloyl-ACP methyl ester carboxylesterase
MDPIRPMRQLAAALLALLLAGCASLAPAPVVDPAGAVVPATLALGDMPVAAQWYLPSGEATALLVLEHGFTRGCGQLRGTSRQLMAAGLAVLCVEASMAGGNPALADTLARRLSVAQVAPDGRVLPQRIIVGGHSAGAAFAAALGARLDELAPDRLAGALLFDPVATADFESQLRAVSAAGRRPVLAVLAPPHRCNAQSNALPALQHLRAEALAAQRDAFVGLRYAVGATHADIEGEDTDWLAALVCGTPQAVHTARLRELAVSWARELARGRQPRAPAFDDALPIE